MAKSFNSLKSKAGMSLSDKFTFGKYKDCRLIDILDEEGLWYIDFLLLKKVIRLDKDARIVYDSLHTSAELKVFFNNEVKPYFHPYNEYDDDDIPF